MFSLDRNNHLVLILDLNYLDGPSASPHTDNPVGQIVSKRETRLGQRANLPDAKRRLQAGYPVSGRHNIESEVDRLINMDL